MKDAEKVSNVKAWVKPKIVVEVKYYERSKHGVFRFPDSESGRTRDRRNAGSGRRETSRCSPLGQPLLLRKPPYSLFPAQTCLHV